MNTLDTKIQDFVEQCHLLADLFDKETAMINKNDLKDLPHFTEMKSRLGNNIHNLNEIFSHDKDNAKTSFSSHRPIVEGAKKRLDESIKKNQLALSRSKNLLENLLRFVAKKMDKQDRPKNIYNNQSHIVSQDKTHSGPVTCNKVC